MDSNSTRGFEFCTYFHDYGAFDSRPYGGRGTWRAISGLSVVETFGAKFGVRYEREGLIWVGF